MREEYRDSTGRVYMVVESRWYDPICAVISIPLILLLRFQPIQKLIRYRRIVKFCITGGVSTIAALATLWIMTDVAGVYYLASNLVAVTVSTTVWFVGNATWTFSDRKTTGWGVPKTLIVRAVTIGLHTALLALFVEVFGVWYIVGAVLATLIGFMLSFVLSNMWIWKHEKRESHKVAH